MDRLGNLALEIPHSFPTISDKDMQAVHGCLQSFHPGAGSGAERLKAVIGESVDRTGVVLANSGAAALRVALHAYGVSESSRVAIPSYVCPSVLSSVRATGATPILYDTSGPWVATSEDLDRVSRFRPDVMVRVHTFGIDASCFQSDTLDYSVIDDLCQAFPLQPIRPGGCSIFSFSATKYVTAGEGGALATNDSSLLSRARELTRGQERFSDLAAALGQSQVESVPEFLKRRRTVAERYLEELPHHLTGRFRDASPASVFFRLPLTVAHPESLIEQLGSVGIQARRGVDSLLHRHLGLPDSDFPSSMELFNTTVSLPLYPSLTDVDVDRIIDAVWSVAGGRDR